MNKNTLLFLNNLIYGIYNVPDFEHMKRSFLEMLRTLIMFECGSIIMAEGPNKTGLSDDVLTIPMRYAEVERKYNLLKEYDYSRWHMQGAQSNILRTSELMSDEEREKTTIYKHCFEPFGLYYSVEISIICNDRPLGLIAIYRQKAQGDFTDQEVFILQLLKEHLNARFYREKMDASGSSENQLLKKAALKYGLSERETEIASMIAAGMNNEEISTKLSVAPNTLKKHLQHIYTKTGIHNRTRLVSLSLPEED